MPNPSSGPFHILLVRSRSTATKMKLVFAVFSAVCVIAQIKAVFSQSCSPRYPAVIAGPGGDDPSQDTGIWYAYRQNGARTVNQVISVTGFGATIESLTGLPASRNLIQTAHSTSTQGPACQNSFTISTYINNGMVTGYQTASSSNYTVISRNDINILYHDYGNLLVAYGCAVPKADGTCDSPIIWAQTRRNPSELSVNQMIKFDSIINAVFSDYCITTDLLPKQIHDSNQEPCPNLDPPACLSGLVDGMRETVPQPNADNTPGSCQWPVYMPPVVSYSPEKHEGVWYVYRQIWSAELTAVNLQLNWHILGKGVLPLTNKPGSHAWVELAQYDKADDTECSHGYWTGFLASAGENPGFRYVEAADRQVPLRTTTLYADDQFVLYYGCVIPNLQTGICKDAFGIFCTRSDPSEWTESEKLRVDNEVIGPLFQGTGCTAKDFPILPRAPEKPACAFLGDTACLRQYNDGFMELVKGYAGY